MKIIALKVLDDSGSGLFEWDIDALSYLCEFLDAYPEINLSSTNNISFNMSFVGYMNINPEEMISTNNPVCLCIL